MGRPAANRVLAKTRQAANIQNAATYQKAGEITKAMLELSKALNNNSVCRTPAMVMLSPEVRLLVMPTKGGWEWAPKGGVFDVGMLKCGHLRGAVPIPW
eukprot:1160898-Pelagomonas_calceolata.AAC.3